MALEARQHDLWSSPHGVLMAAKRNKATVSFDSKGGRSLAAVSFTEPGVMSAVAYINDDGLVERVESRHPHPVTGDTAVTTLYSDYRDHGGVKFPMRIRQSHLGSPTLDLEVKEVQVNPATDIVAPDAVRNFAERVASQPVTDGVWYLAGGSHHSVLIEMKDHLIVVESPLYDGRAQAMLQEVKKLVPGKPIRTVINSHHHFDHSGGLRTAAAEGATLMVTAAAKPYFEKVLANANRIKPDALARSGRKAKFASYGGKTLLTDGSRNIEVYSIDGSVHAKGFTMVYLPKEKLLIEADAFTPGPPNSPPPAKPNDNHVNLLENIERRNLAVDRILPLHGRVVPLAELQTAVGRKP
ncbi:MAG TPA: MBL fold metallo-hydrolase [Burkholderiaceae bacterium]|nr:MBL fold metallo-hydrolase [Burkholderiaceae bacterium]